MQDGCTLTYVNAPELGFIKHIVVCDLMSKYKRAFESKFIRSFYPNRDKSVVCGPLDDLVMTTLSALPSLD